MKYSVVLMALLGTAAARHHHHHHHHQAPVAFAQDDAEDAGEEAVDAQDSANGLAEDEASAEDEAAPKKGGAAPPKKGAKGAKGASAPKKAGKGGKGASPKKGKSASKKAKSASKGKGKGKKAATVDPYKATGDGGRWTPADSRRVFELHVGQAANVVANQAKFEAKQTAEIKAINDKASAEARALRNKVGAARWRQTAGDYPQNPFPWVKQWAAPPQTLSQVEADPVKEDGPKRGTPARSYYEKEESLKAVRAAVAEQERFMAEHNAMVARNYAADTAAANAERARVSRARQTQIQGGMPY
jgi:hypothetical protein